MTKHSSLLVSVVVLCVFVAQSALAATYYVDGVNGVDGQAATSWATARKTINNGEAVATNAGDVLKIRGVHKNVEVHTDNHGITYEGVYSEDTGYMPFLHGATELDETLMTNRPGYLNTWMHDNAKGGSTWVFTAPSGTDLADVANWTPLTKAADIDAVNTTTGSFQFVSSDKLYVHTPDSSHPTNYSIIYATGNPVFFLHHSDLTIKGFIIAFTWDNQGVFSLSSTLVSNIVVTGNTLGPWGRLEVEGVVNLEYSSNIAYRTGMIVDETVSNAVVRGNTISYYDGPGIRSTSMGTLDMSYNTVHDCTDYGIQIYDGDGQRTQADIYNNTVYSNARVGISMQSVKDYFDINIYNNTAHDNGQNIRLDRPGNGFDIAGVASIFNNTCLNSEGWTSDTDGFEIHGMHIRKRPDPDVTKVFNNIICQDAGAGGIDAFAIFSASSRAILNDYNNLHVTDGALVGFYGLNSSTCTTLAEWRTATGNGDNSISADPGFVDLASAPKDLHITAGSPCFNTGVASWQSISAPSTDIDGDARPHGSAHDMGSDEHVPTPGTLITIQ